MWWQRFTRNSRRQRRPPAEINIWRLQSLFNNFRRILSLNNAILEDIAQLERMLGGEFIFDRNFLDNKVRDIASKVHHVTYNLNALTGNAYIGLYDRYQEIRGVLDEILSGTSRDVAENQVIPLADVDWELEHLVGIDLVCLAELRHHRGVQPARGFVITSEGIRLITRADADPAPGDNGRNSAAEVRAGIAEEIENILADEESGRFAVIINRLDDEQELVREVASYMLVPAGFGGRKVEIIARNEGSVHLSGGEPELEDDGLERADVYVRSLVRIIKNVYATAVRRGMPETAQLAVFVRSSRPAVLAGTVRSRAGNIAAADTLSVEAHLPRAESEFDVLLLRRTYPFVLARSVISPRPAGFRFLDGQLALDEAVQNSGFVRGSALLDIENTRLLAGTAITLERIMGTPIRARWEFYADGTCVINRLLPEPVVRKEDNEKLLTEEREAATVLCQGGQMVQAGVAAGRILHVTEETSVAEFPGGGIAVARAASPQLTPVLQRAAALITEHGSAIGHLATVARELRLPAIFGVADARDKLPDGMEVTVDAGETTVYQGILAELLRYGSHVGPDFSPADLEYRLLRRLLRYIMHLNLIDPEAESFVPEGCRTFHDIIHFAHEKAVEELAHFQERRPGLGTIRTRRLELGVPMDIRVLDVGDGLSEANPEKLGLELVRSEPFRAFLEGLLQPRAWDSSQPSLGLRDIFSNAPRTMGLLSAPADTLGENLAILGHDYTNISLRMGYHFSVIDAHLGADDYRNYVYFRFVGGLADAEKRKRRARFIKDVLAIMDFKVSVKGDLVIGRLKSAPAEVLRCAMAVLGALTAFSRQRDTSLAHDDDARALLTTFVDTFSDLFPHAAFGPGGSQAKDGGPSPELAMNGSEDPT